MKSYDLEIIGLRKTKEKFIRNIFKKRENEKDFLNSLKQLQIFKKIDLKLIKNDKYKLFVEENKYKISAGTKLASTGNFIPYLQFNIPNLFGFGESFNLFISSIKSLELNFRIPQLNKKSNFNFLEFCVSTSNSYIDASNEIKTQKYAINYKSNYKYSFIYDYFYNNSGLFYLLMKNPQNTKIHHCTQFGLFEKKIFSKIDIFLKETILLPFKFFYKIQAHIGIIHGHPHFSLKYLLGDAIRGYKSMSISPLDRNERIGGLSCIEFSNSLGFSKNIFKFFIFTDIGFSSRQNNLIETINSAIKSLFLDQKPKTIGFSTGLGFCINIKKQKKCNIDFTMSYAFPSFHIDNTNNFDFGIDLDIL